MLDLRSSPKTDPLSLRTVAPEVTEARVTPLLAKVPITRLSDLTPLDPLRLPVWSAVTPLASDLTTHLGKGLDATQARVSAMMEAIERTSAERTPAAAVEASWDELGRDGRSALDPTLFDLPSDTAYSPEQTLSWSVATDLHDGTELLIASDLAVTPPREGVLQEVDTNGLASGNTVLEAVLHGLCEVVERDVLSQLEFCSLFGSHDRPAPAVRDIDPTTLPTEICRWTEKLAAAGLHCRHQDVTSDIGVATIRTVLLDPAYPTDSGPTAVRFVGCGTAPDARIALLRSVTEAVQSRLSFVQSARDSFNAKALGLRATSRDAYRREMSVTTPTPLAAVPSFESDDLLTDLRYVLARLRAAGVGRAVAVDLTRPDLDVPVVRVRVPGLSSFYVNRRRPGWRCLRHLL